MTSILTIPQELLDQIGSSLSAQETSRLLQTCHTLCIRFAPSLHIHAISPVRSHPALHWAAYNGHVPLARYLLSYPDFHADLPNEAGATPLHTVMNGIASMEMTKLLLGHGANINARDSKGATPLVKLCRWYVAKISHVQIFIDHGADLNAQNNKGFSPLSCSLRSRRDDIVILLLGAGADPGNLAECDGEMSYRSAVTPVLFSCQENNLVVLTMLLKKGADVNYANRWGETGLLIAVQVGAKECVKVLLGAGADVNAIDSRGGSAVLYAVQQGFHHILGILLKAGAVTNWRNNEGATALEWACSRGYPEVVGELLRVGCGREGEDVFEQGMSAVEECSRERAKKRILKLLVEEQGR